MPELDDYNNIVPISASSIRMWQTFKLGKNGLIYDCHIYFDGSHWCIRRQNEIKPFGRELAPEDIFNTHFPADTRFEEVNDSDSIDPEFVPAKLLTVNV